MKNSQARQTLLTVILPGLILGTIYILWPRAEMQKGVRNAKQLIEQQQKKAPSAPEMAQQMRLQAQLEEEIEQLKNGFAQNSKLKAIPVSASFDRSSSSGEYSQLNRLLTKHRLTLLEEIAAERISGVAVPASFQKNFSSPTTSHLRSLRFHGRYLDALAFFKEIQENPLRSIPVQLNMTRVPGNNRVLEWSLVLWI